MAARRDEVTQVSGQVHGSSAGYAHIRQLILAPEQHPRGLSQMDTLIEPDLPERFAEKIKPLRRAIQTHIELTERVEREVTHALQCSRDAVRQSGQALARAEGVEDAMRMAERSIALSTNAVSDVEGLRGTLNTRLGRADTAVRWLSRSWTAMLVLSLANAIVGAASMVGVGWVLFNRPVVYVPAQSLPTAPVAPASGP